MNRAHKEAPLLSHVTGWSRLSQPDSDRLRDLYDRYDDSCMPGMWDGGVNADFSGLFEDICYGSTWDATDHVVDSDH